MLFRSDADISGQKDIEKYLENANKKLADVAFEKQNKLLGDMVTTGSNNMKLRYNLND